MMEVDMQSPSFTTPRFMRKRARSPEDSPSPDERYLKRRPMLVASRSSSVEPVSSGFVFYNDPHEFASGDYYVPRPGEDLACRTDEMSLESPLILDSRLKAPDTVTSNMSFSEDHNMQLEIQQPFPEPMNHILPPGDLQLYSGNMTQTPAPPTNSDILHSTPSLLRLAPSRTSSSGPEPLDAEIAQSSLLLDNGASLVDKRPQRFSMGPRTDCEKCRLRVAGHWIHFD